MEKIERASLSESPYRSDDIPDYWPKDIIVWWYGPLIKSRSVNTVPKVLAFFRELINETELGRFLQININIYYLKYYYIG